MKRHAPPAIRSINLMNMPVVSAIRRSTATLLACPNLIVNTVKGATHGNARNARSATLAINPTATRIRIAPLRAITRNTMAILANQIAAVRTIDTIIKRTLPHVRALRHPHVPALATTGATSIDINHIFP